MGILLPAFPSVEAKDTVTRWDSEWPGGTKVTSTLATHIPPLLEPPSRFGAKGVLLHHLHGDAVRLAGATPGHQIKRLASGAQRLLQAAHVWVIRRGTPRADRPERLPFRKPQPQA